MGLLFKTLAKQRMHYKGLLFFFLVMTLVMSLASVFMTRLTGNLGQAALDMDMGALLRLFAIITVVMVIRATASAFSALFLGRFAGKAGYRFRENFTKYFLQKPFVALEQTKSGESLSVFSNDLPASVELVSNGGIRLIADVIVLLVAFAYLFILNWWLTLIFIAAFPILIVMQSLISSPIQKKSARRLEARAKATAVANDSFLNADVAAVYSLEDLIKARYHSALDKWIDASKSVARSYLVLIVAGILASVTPLLIIVTVSAHQVISGSMNIAEWIAFITLAGEAGNWLLTLSQRQNQVQTAAGGARRLGEYMRAELENAFAGKALNPNGDTAISVTNLSFSYNADAEHNLGESSPALNNVSFKIMQGSKVAIVGASGSGKSTVLKLLLGLYTSQGGKIFVMGEDSSNVSLQSLRNSFAYVPQDCFLFPDTILRNITGESEFDMQRLHKACSDAGILEFIESLPGGFNANVNESAENISGGQKQRIALARAFYRDAPIILFDEATSALDPATEVLVLQSFDNLAKDKTVIMVAHRLKAIDFCDSIVVMDNGKIVATGTHGELMTKCKLYADMYGSQDGRKMA